MAYTPLSELTASMGNYYELVIKPSYEQDTAQGETTVQVSYGVRKTGANYATYNLDGAHFWASFNGTAVPGGDGSLSPWDQRSDPVGTYHEFATYTGTVKCAADGTSSVALYAKFDVGAVSAAKDAEINRTISLPRIPRASAISATPTYIGQATVITIQKASPEFTHTITATCGAYTATVGPEKRSETTISWVVPGELYQYTPGMSTVVSLLCMTYSGDTAVGQFNCSFVASIYAPNNVPLINSCSAEDEDPGINNLTGDGSIVRYMSDITCKLSASAKNYATIKGVMVNGQAMEYTAETGTWDTVIQNTSTGKFVFTVTDSRGLTTTQTIEKKIVPYVITTLKYNWARSSSVGSTVTVNMSGTFYNGAIGETQNELTVTVQVKPVDTEDWGDIVDVTPQITGNNWTGSATLEGLSYDKSYEVYILALDSFATATRHAEEIVFVVPPGVPVFDWGKNDFTVNKRLRLGSDVQVLNSSSAYVTAAQVKQDNYIYIGAEPNAELTGTKIQGQIVQIGASNLGRKTTVYGNPLVINLDNYDSRINVYKAAGGYISFLFIDKNDTLQISDNSVSMYLHGKTITSNVAISQSSDRGMKKAVEPLSGNYEKLLDGMEPCRYRYKDEADNDPYHLGYIAQDVLTAMNDAGLDRSDFAAVVGEEGDLGIAYTELIPLLHQKIKSQEARIERLEGLVEQLLAAQGGGAP